MLRKILSVRAVVGTIDIYDEGASIAIASPYDPAFVQALKMSIPAIGRQWQKPFWVVAKKYAKELPGIINDYYGVEIRLPDYSGVDETEVNVLYVEYIGYCKIRMSGLPSPSSFAYTNGGWNAVFPEVVLRSFFNQTDKANEADSYYGVLGLSSTATDDDIKKAFKRLSRQWHPDVCREPDAEEMFKLINEANQVISDPTKRRKYDACLSIEADYVNNRKTEADLINEVYSSFGNSYRPPLRCGLVTVEYVPMAGGKSIVSKILAWDDIIDDNGRVMSSYWSMDNEMFLVSWV